MSISEELIKECCKFIDNTTKLKLRITYYNSPRIRGLIKIDIKQYPYRPIV